MLQLCHAMICLPCYIHAMLYPVACMLYFDHVITMLSSCYCHASCCIFMLVESMFMLVPRSCWPYSCLGVVPMHIMPCHVRSLSCYCCTCLVAVLSCSYYCCYDLLICYKIILLKSNEHDLTVDQVPPNRALPVQPHLPDGHALMRYAGGRLLRVFTKVGGLRTAVALAG